MDEVVSSINRTVGDACQVHLELWKWETDAVPQIGPGRRQVIDDQIPSFDLYLGIMSASFGDGATEEEFRKALSNWLQAGTPWILFYFDDDPKVSRKPQEVMEYAKVCEFREQLESQGIVCGYVGVRGSKHGFYDKALGHLLKTIHLLAPPPRGVKPTPPPANPGRYLRDLLDKTSHIDIRGLQAGTGRANHFPIEQLFISLTATGASSLEDTAVKAQRRKHKGCRFVVTSRPAAYTADVLLPDFAHAKIDDLSDESVETFLSKWCEAIYIDSPHSAGEHCEELLSSLRARREIRRMARNPVMLTALAVVHWNERRLPEQRADLYDSIITWLSRSREQREGRATADQTVVLLQELALAMQDDPQGRNTQVPKRTAAEKLAGEFGDGKVSKVSIAAAERFLDEEEVDSGIIVGRGNEVAYWHLTFQEFLAVQGDCQSAGDRAGKDPVR